MDSIQRVQVWKDTIHHCKKMNIMPSLSIKYTTRPKLQGTRSYENTNVIVVNEDCIEQALKYHMLNPVILNLADDSFPGGSVDVGSGAQEESIFRRTDIYRTLNHQTGFYPLKNIDAIYSPLVHIIKNRDGSYKDTTYSISVISVPGIRMPMLVNGHLTEDDRILLEDKIRMILDIGLLHNHGVIVLGAIGCGAWRNPPEDVAMCFKRVLPEYIGKFDTIAFAVLEVPQSDYLVRRNHSSGIKTNYTIFKEVLES